MVPLSESTIFRQLKQGTNQGWTPPSSPITWPQLRTPEVITVASWQIHKEMHLRKWLRIISRTNHKISWNRYSHIMSTWEKCRLLQITRRPYSHLHMLLAIVLKEDLRVCQIWYKKSSLWLGWKVEGRPNLVGLILCHRIRVITTLKIKCKK